MLSSEQLFNSTAEHFYYIFFNAFVTTLSDME